MLYEVAEVAGQEEEMAKHFVLVHGICLGAWCWYKVVPLLKSMGHKVTTLDLAASGINPKQAHEVRCITDYAEPLMEFLTALPAEEKIILVGHSLGGVVASIAMEKFPQKIAAAVLLSTYMPGPDLPYFAIVQQMAIPEDYFLDSQYGFDNGPGSLPTSMLFGPEYIASRLYDRSPPEDLALASMLLRPSPLFVDAESMKGSDLTKDNYGSVRRVFIICTDENGFKGDLQRWMAEKNPPDEVKYLHGSDHMAMCSKPSELCSLLSEVAEKYQ